MAIAATLSYAITCVYYAGRTLLLFTVQLLWFLPAYFLVERHDTRSAWLGRRGEAQVQPVLPTAYHYDKAAEERAGSPDGEHLDIVKLCALQSMQPLLQQPSTVSSPQLDGTAREAEERRCVSAHRAVRGVRSLRPTHALHAAGGSLGSGSGGGGTSPSGSSWPWSHVPDSLAASPSAAHGPGSSSGGGGGVAVDALRRARVLSSTSPALPMRSFCSPARATTAAAAWEGEEDSEGSWSNYTMATTPSASTAQRPLSMSPGEIAMPRDGAAGAMSASGGVDGNGGGGGLRAARGAAVTAHAALHDSTNATRDDGEGGAGPAAAATGSLEGTPLRHPTARPPARLHAAAISFTGRLSSVEGDGGGGGGGGDAAAWLSCVTDVFFDGVAVRAAAAVPSGTVAAAARPVAEAAAGRWGRGRPVPPAWRAAVAQAHAAGVAAEAKMRRAVPAWCAVQFQSLAAQTSSTTAEATAAAAAHGGVPFRGQFGFLPPWYAVHARAQLLLALVDPLLRIAAELLCCRGWGSARLCADSGAAGERADARSPVSEGRGRAYGSGNGDDTNARAAVAVLAQPLLFCLRVLRRLVDAFLLGSTDAAALRQTSAAPHAPTSTLPRQPRSAARRGGGASAGGGGGGGGGFSVLHPLRRLEAAVHARVDGYVADTQHTFECLLADTTPTGTGDPHTAKANPVATPAPVSVTAHGLSNSTSTSTTAAASLSKATTHVSAPSATTASAAACAKSVGVYWLHGRRPSATWASTAPVVVLLLCPSLLQGSGLHAHAVIRLSHVCQLLTLAGRWQSSLATPTPHDDEDEEEGEGEAKTPTHAPVRPTTCSRTRSSSSSSGSGEEDSEDAAGPRCAGPPHSGPAAPEWYAAVPVVELRAPAAEPGQPDDVSMPPLTLRDLRHIVERLRTQLESTPATNSAAAAEGTPRGAVPGNPLGGVSSASAAPRARAGSRPAEATAADSGSSPPPSPSVPLPPDAAAAATAGRRVYVVAVGWSEAASPLLELAITQPQQHHCHPSTPRLDGVVCVSHTLSSTFQLLPQQQPAEAMRRQEPPPHRHPLATRAAPSPLGTTRRTSFSTTTAMTTPGTGSIVSSGAASPLAPSTGPPSARPSPPLPPSGVSTMYAAPHMPRLLSRLTTGPARLLLLMTRMEMIADALRLHRHQHTQQPLQQQRRPMRSRSGSPVVVVATAAGAGFAKSRHASLPTSGSPRGAHVRGSLRRAHRPEKPTTTTTAHASTAAPSPPDNSLYHFLQVFHEAREEVNRAQRGLDRATILWTQQRHQRGVHHPAPPPPPPPPQRPQRSQPAPHGPTAASLTSRPPTRRPEAEGEWGVEADPVSATAASTAAFIPAPTTAPPRQRTSPPPPPLSQHGLRVEPPGTFARTVHSTAVSAMSAAPTAPSSLDVPHHAATWSSSPLLARQDAPQDASPTLWRFPRLETATDWEELAHSPMMTAVQAQQRLDAANITVSDLPPPPSVDPPTHLGHGAGPTHVAPTSNALTGGAGGSDGSGRRGGTARRRRFTTGLGVAGDAAAADPLAATASVVHPPSLRASAVPLHRTWSHLSTEDVIAACSLQVVSPNARQVAWLPGGGGGGDGGRGARLGVAGAAGLPDGGGALLRPSPTATAAAPGVARSPAATDAEGGAAAAAAHDIRPTAALAGPAPADSGTSSDGDAPPAASAATPTPENSFAASAPPHRPLDDASERDGARRDAETSALLYYSHHTSTATGAMTTSLSSAPQLKLSPFVPTPPSTSAVSQSGTSTPAPASHAVAPASGASSVYRCDAAPQQRRASPPASAAAAATGSPPPPPSTPYPALPFLRTPALSSQAAALVELRVRSAQHAALIQRIRVPTLLVHARDDPVARTATLPFSLLQANPWITTVLTRRGSHAVFMEGAAEVWRRPRLLVTQYWHPVHDSSGTAGAVHDVESAEEDGGDGDDGAYDEEPRSWTSPRPRRRERRHGGGGGGGAGAGTAVNHDAGVREGGAPRRHGRPASPPPWQPLTASPMLPARPPATAKAAAAGAGPAPPTVSLTVAASRPTPLPAAAAFALDAALLPARGTAKEDAATCSSSSSSYASFTTTTTTTSASASSNDAAACGDGVGATALDGGGIVEWLPVHNAASAKKRSTAGVPAAAADAQPAHRVGASPAVSSHWQVRMEGTTWLERLIFEYVEKVVLSAAAPPPPPLAAPLSPPNTA